VNAVQYAEQELGVHKVYEEANAFLADLDMQMTALDAVLDTRRTLDEKISDYEMDLAIEERGKHADHSEAAFARHLKEVLHKDQTLRDLKQERNTAASKASGLELDIEHTKYKIKVRVARMEELNGLLQFYGVAKLTEAATSGRPAASGGEAN